MSNPIRPATDEDIAALSLDLQHAEPSAMVCNDVEDVYIEVRDLSRIIARIEADKAAREADRATIAEQAKRIRVLEAQNLTYRLADNPATVEAFQSEMEEAEATIADLRDEAERSERLVADILASARREREDLRAEVRRLEGGQAKGAAKRRDVDYAALARKSHAARRENATAPSPPEPEP